MGGSAPHENTKGIRLANGAIWAAKLAWPSKPPTETVRAVLCFSPHSVPLTSWPDSVGNIDFFPGSSVFRVTLTELSTASES